jgi:type IV pilus assembly protein PilV
MSIRQQRGFSLIEILVSIALVAMGLLAITLLTTKTIQANKESFQVSLATQWAQAYAQRMVAATGNKMYAYNTDTAAYDMSPILTCYDLVINEDAGKEPAAIPNVCAPNAAQDLADADMVSMDPALVLPTLPKFSYQLRLVRDGQPTSKPASIAECSFESSTLDTKPKCVITIVMAWDKVIADESNNGVTRTEQVTTTFTF